MKNIRDLTGEKFGRLTVSARAQDHVRPSGQRERMWLCRCECGQEKVILGERLKCGITKSCGCFRKERARELQKMHWKHGHSSSTGSTREYHSWRSMLQRCYKPTSSGYHCYGGRGITVCDEWRSDFARFLKDMGERPIGKSLDRIENDKNYCKENCQWSAPKRQSRNRQQSMLISVGGETRQVDDWADFTGINRSTIKNRIDRGWTPTEAVTRAPSKKRRFLKAK